MPCVRIYFRVIVLAIGTDQPKLWERAAKNASLLFSKKLQRQHYRCLATLMLSALSRCESEGSKASKSLLYILRQCVKVCSEGVGEAAKESLKICGEQQHRTRLFDVVRPITLQELQFKGCKVWEEIAEMIGISLQHRISKQGENCASLVDEEALQPSARVDPRSFASWNVNGFKARWGKGISAEPLQDVWNNKKKLRELPFPAAVERIGTPEVLFALESKITLSNLLKLPNFQAWRKKCGYTFLGSTWSGEIKGKSQEGYAGVTMFSKHKPLKVIFGFGGNQLDGEKEGRLITAIFRNIVVIGEYSPCSGWSDFRRDKKLEFETKMVKHLQYLRKQFPNKSVIRAGDLNVNPRDCDCSPQASEQWRRHRRNDEKQASMDGPTPGCRPEEIKAYDKTNLAFEGVNVWEQLYPAKMDFHTWAHPYDRYGLKGYGQRIDHFVVNKSLMKNSNNLRVSNMRVHMGLGTSDHWPITLWLETATGAREAERTHALRMLKKKGTYSSHFQEWVGAQPDKERVFTVNKEGSPVISLKIGPKGLSQKCFIDTGSPLTIFNPDEGTCPEDDPTLGSFFRGPPASTRGCILQGVGGATIETKRSYNLPFLMGNKIITTLVMCLDKHEKTLPKLLIGQQASMDDFGGMCMLPDKSTGGIKICFKNSEGVWFHGEGLVDQTNREDDAFAKNALLGSSKVFHLASSHEGVKRVKEQPAMEDELDNLSSRAMQNCFVEGRCPAIDIKIKTKEENDEWWDGLAAIDTHSTHNFVSRDFLKATGKDTETTLIGTPMEVVTMTGEVAIITEYVNLKICVNLGGAGNDVHLDMVAHVFPDIETEITIGVAAQRSMGVALDTARTNLIIQPSPLCGLRNIPIESWVDWRTAIPLRTSLPTVLPPRSQSKVMLQRVDDKHMSNFEKVKIIAPTSQTFGSRAYKTAWGPCDDPTWIQIANPTFEPIRLGKGEHVAELHLGGGWDVKSLDLDPSVTEHIKEQTETLDIREAQLVRALNVLGVQQAGKRVDSPCAIYKLLPQNPRSATASSQNNNNTHTHMSVDDTVVYMHDKIEEKLAAGRGKSIVGGGSSPLTDSRSELDCAEVGLTCPHPTIFGQNADVNLHKLSHESKVASLNKLGIDLTETIACRTKEEVDLLVDWCMSRKDSMAKDGKLDFAKKSKHNTKMSIETVLENPVFKAYAGRVTPDRLKEIQKQTEEKLKQGIIEKSSAPWSSNCVCISKNGKIRIAVDYRKLNEVTVKDNYLLPTIQECLDQLHGTRFFTSIDAAQAYHQIPLATERDKDLTSFVVPGGGLYRYKYMPFGLVNAGAVWTRFIDEVLEGLRWNICLVYADDILVYTKSNDVRDHIRDLDKVFDKLDEYNVQVKGDKMRLALRELPFLGQLVSEEGCRPDPLKTRAITDLVAPTSVHQLRRVMGMFAYYRKYIKGFADIAAPLYELCGKNAQNKRNAQTKNIALSERQMKAFEELKRLLTTEPIFLKFPEWNAPFEVHCDASDVGVAAVLWQKSAEGEDKGVVMYASRMLTPAERKYHAYEKEALALVWSLDLFSHYLRRRFRVITDCRSLTYLKTNSSNTRVARWMLRLQEFDFDIQHRPGRLSSDCDGMTRQPLQSTNPYGESPAEPLYDDAPHKSVFVYTDMPSEDKVVDVRPITRASRSKEQTSDTVDTSRKRPGRPRKENAAVEKEVVVERGLDNKHGDQPPEDPQEATASEETFFDCAKDLQGWNIETWLAEQSNPGDKGIGLIKEHLRKALEDGRETKFCYTVDGLLARKKEDKAHRHRIVVPESLKAFVLGQHHNMPLHAHQGRERLLKMVASRYYWSKMSADIKRWTDSCASCIKRKTPRKMGMGLTTNALASEPWEVIGVDLVGECLQTTSGNKWILTITDHFTRWPIAVAIPDKKASTVARVLYEHLVTEHGVPRKILTDQGKEFVNEAIDLLCSRWGIKKVVTGGYNPQANGACERFHRWLNAAMTQLYDRKSPDWDQYLPAISFAYRVSQNDSTGYSPFFLNKGREATLPSDVVFSPEEIKKEENSYVEDMTEKLRKSFEIARHRQFSAFTDNLHRQPDRHKPNYSKGDLVMIYSKTAKEARLEIAGDKRSVPTKWRNPWVGPARFEQEVSNTSCKVYFEGKEILVNYNRIGRFVPWDDLIESSDEWKDRAEGRVAKKTANKQHGEPMVSRCEGDHVLVGDVFLFEMEGETETHHNFGVGMVLNTTDTHIHFQWMGSYHQNFSAHLNGSFKLGWIDTTKNCEYYKNTKETKRHTVFTGQMTNTTVQRQCVLLTGRDNVLTKDNRLTSKALKLLRV